MTFHFAWAGPAETTFGVEHQVEDEEVFAFTLEHTIRKPDGTLCGRLKTVHVAVDRIGGKAVALPPEVRAALGA